MFKGLKVMLSLSFLLVADANLHADEGSIGNGGGAWVCQSSDGSVTNWAVLVDLYEGRAEFKLTIHEENRSLSYQEIVGIKKTRLLSAGRGFYDVLSPYIDEVFTSLVFVDADLAVVDDALYRIRPSRRQCASGDIEYVQLANYTDYGKILIQNQIWNDARFSSTDRAALIFHEAVYAYLREEKDERNSVRTRELVAYLFSDLPTDRLSEEIKRMLGESGNPEPAPCEKRPCGLSGRIDERIRNCNTNKQAKGFTWVLVTRTEQQKKEVWRDNASGILWGDSLLDAMDHYVTSMDHYAALEVCGKERSLEARGGITNLNWFLPSIDDYESAEEHGIREVLPNMAGWRFWSSSVCSSAYQGYARVFCGSGGYVGYGYRVYDDGSVRCVSR